VQSSKGCEKSTNVAPTKNFFLFLSPVGKVPKGKGVERGRRESSGVQKKSYFLKKMKTKKILFGLFIVLLSASGCITEYRAVLSGNHTRVLFVDGSIVENTDAIFHITQSFGLDVSGVPDEAFVNNAILRIIDSNGNESEQATSLGRGRYRIRVGNLDADIQYGIRIEHDGEIYESTLLRPLITPEIDSISWRQNDNETISFHVSTTDDEGDARFFMWNYVEDWEVRVVAPTAIFFNPRHVEQVTEPFYIDWSYPFEICWKNHISDRFLMGSTEALSENRLIEHQIFEHDITDDRFSRLYSVLVTQRAISQAAYEYFENLRKQNEEMGGLFTPQPTEILGNIRSTTNPARRVIGYVEAVKSISQKRIFVDRSELLNRPTTHTRCDFLFDDHSAQPPLLRLPRPGQYADYYNRGYRPSKINMERYESEIAYPAEWALKECTDCRELGGTLNRPDFWPR